MVNAEHLPVVPTTPLTAYEVQVFTDWLEDNLALEPGEDDVDVFMSSEVYAEEKAYATGFKDALQSLVLALRDSKTLTDALVTAAEAFANNKT